MRIFITSGTNEEDPGGAELAALLIKNRWIIEEVQIDSTGLSFTAMPPACANPETT